MKNESVILVDVNDDEVGVCEKLEAHQKSLLHRAFSIFIFNHKNELILQKRALKKYHSGGLWSNTCCGHPKPNEETLVAAKRRLIEEMGIYCELEFKFSFIYKIGLNNNLFEHEYDHVFIGETNQIPVLNPEEVSEWKTITMAELKNDLNKNPDHYTAWLKLCLENNKFNLLP